MLSRSTAVLLAYLLVLQSLLASMALGTLAAASTGPAQIICTMKGPVVLNPAADRDLPVKTTHDWHCAALCQAASAGTPTVPGAQTGVLSAPRQQGVAVAFSPADIAQSVATGVIPEARAPPRSI